MFVNLKNSSMFASFNAKERNADNVVNGIFYAVVLHIVLANIQGYQTPLYGLPYSNVSKCSLARTGGDSLSYFLLLTNNFIRKMPKNNEITNFVNNSSDVCTLRSTRTAPIGFKPQTQQSQQFTNIPPVKKHEKYVSFADVLAELESRFTVEMNAKNKAYDFFLQMGLLDEFQKFSQATKGQNHFNNCLTTLTQM